jgi:hypothetical protein
MSVEKLLTAYTKVYGKPESEIKEKLFTEVDGNLTLNDDADTIIISWDEEKVNRFKTKETEAYNKGHKTAKKESLTDYEKALKAAGILDEADSGHESIIAKFESIKAGNTKAALTDDDVKKHPAYLAYEEKVKKEYLPKSEHDAKLAEFQSKIDNISKAEKVQKLKEAALKYFDPNNYILSETPEIRQNQINTVIEKILNQFEDAEFVGDSIVMIKDGKKWEDEHGNTRSFTVLIDAVAGTFYDKKAQSAKEGANNKNKTEGKNNQQTVLFTGKTLSELMTERNKKQSEAKTAEEKLLIGKIFLEYKKKLNL